MDFEEEAKRVKAIQIERDRVIICNAHVVIEENQSNKKKED